MRDVSTEEYIKMIDELSEVLNKHGYKLGICAPYHSDDPSNAGIVMQIFVEEAENE